VASLLARRQLAGRAILEIWKVSISNVLDQRDEFSLKISWRFSSSLKSLSKSLEIFSSQVREEVLDLHIEWSSSFQQHHSTLAAPAQLQIWK
jgi:hypothetical protein